MPCDSKAISKQREKQFEASGIDLFLPPEANATDSFISPVLRSTNIAAFPPSTLNRLQRVDKPVIGGKHEVACCRKTEPRVMKFSEPDGQGDLE